MTRNVLLAESRTPAASQAMARFHADVVRTVQEAVEKNPVVVVGMVGNPFVKKARKALDEAGVTYTYLGYGSYLSGWKKRLAIKLWSGWPTFPQVFVKGVLIGGATDTMDAVKDGSLKKLLQGP